MYFMLFLSFLQFCDQKGFEKCVVTNVETLSYNSGYGPDMLTCVFVCGHVGFMRPCFCVFVDFIVCVCVCVCVCMCVCVCLCMNMQCFVCVCVCV